MCKLTDSLYLAKGCIMKCAFGSKAETNMNGFAIAVDIKSLMSNDGL